MSEPVYVAVDVETSGPAPGRYALLAIGACLVDDPADAFYAELQPDRQGVLAEAVAVAGLSPADLAVTGRPAADAMSAFADWVDGVAAGRRPVFVAFNAAFDWLFVADYLDRYVGRNPFGHSALDIKALFMGAAGVPWAQTRFADVAAHFGVSAQLPHNALEDARIQASIFARIVAERPEAR